MEISFQKKPGVPSLAIQYFWQLEISVQESGQVSDHIIPELYFDYFFIASGGLLERASPTAEKMEFPPQALKSLHTKPLKLDLSIPLIIFGARLDLRFAEYYWEQSLPANRILEVNWIKDPVDDLANFGSQFATFMRQTQVRRNPGQILESGLDETRGFRQYSPRHRRRLYKSTFGLSRKELLTIQNVQEFLTQTCDFTEEYPRIIQYVNVDVFYDQPHLNHAFKKVTGLAPLEYFERNSVLQDNLMAASYNENKPPSDTITS